MSSALLVLTALFAAAPATFDQSYRAGLVALQANQLDVAEVNLRAAVQLQPKNARAWTALAQTYQREKQTQKATQAAESAMRWGSDDSAVMQSLVVVYSGNGQMMEAASAQARYEALNPRDQIAAGRAALLYFEVARPLLQQQKFAEALRVLETARSKVKTNPQIELALGVTDYGLRRFDEAAKAFLNVITVDPSVEQPYLFLSKMLDSIPSQLPAVTARFAAFEAANPTDARGYLLHAKALNAQSLDAEKARQLLAKSIAIDPTNPAAHTELGTLLERMRAYPEAAVEFERAAALDARDAATHYHLARLYDRLNRPEDAAAQRLLHTQLSANQEAIR